MRQNSQKTRFITAIYNSIAVSKSPQEKRMIFLTGQAARLL
jgi:hypothetical protein